MDSNITQTSQNRSKQIELHHEKKKKKDSNGNHDADVTLNEVCRKMNELAEEEGERLSESSSVDSEDFVNAINYNTITSLAALKDILHVDGGDTPDADSFFQHYFMNHCNTLSSRNVGSPFPFSERRRLSQCREEDEDDDKRESDPPPSAVSSESCSEATSQASITLPSRDRNSSDASVHSPTPTDSPSEERASSAIGSRRVTENRTVMGEKHKFLVTVSKNPQLKERPVSKVRDTRDQVLRSQTHSAHTVHFGNKGPEEVRPSVHSIFPSENLHRDKKYFDSSLIEIRSTTDGSAASSEDIWVKRNEKAKTVATSSSSNANKSSPERKSTSQLDEKTERPRAGTWGSLAMQKDQKVKKELLPSAKEISKKTEVVVRRPRVSVEPTSDAAFTRSSQSVGERRRKTSNDEDPHPMYQQTIHGTSGVSRKPALFDMFKLKQRAEAKKQASIMQQVKTAMQVMGNTQTRVKNEKEEAAPPRVPGDGSAHPHGGSDKTYYHTVMPSSSSGRRSSAMEKVLDLFRSRGGAGGSDSAAQDAAEKKKTRTQQRQGGSTSAQQRRDAERRRSSLGHVHMMPLRHRASDAAIDPQHAAILFRDARGLPVADPFVKVFTALKDEEAQVFVKFFKFHKCYDLMPTSAKLVVFDTKLHVKKAFYALVYNGVRAAPLWDASRQSFVGMLTITDFIKILQMYYTSPNVAMDELEEHRLETWRDVLKTSLVPFVWTYSQNSLYEAISMLIKYRIHRLPLIDPQNGNVVYILTHKRILRFLFLYINDLPKPGYLQCKLRDLKIGTFENIETATEETTIIEALTKFVNRRVSALPIVDKDGRLKDIYAKFDVINLAAEKTYNNLDITLKQANEHRNEWFEGVQKCNMDETLYDVMERLVKAEVHRLVVVDDDDKVTGIISLSDLLAYLVLRPSEETDLDVPTECLRQLSIDEEEQSQQSDLPFDTKAKAQSTEELASTSEPRSLTPVPSPLGVFGQVDSHKLEEYEPKPSTSRVNI